MAAVADIFPTLQTIRTHVPVEVMSAIQSKVDITAIPILNRDYFPELNPKQDPIRRKVWFEFRSEMIADSQRIAGPIIVVCFSDYESLDGCCGKFCCTTDIYAVLRFYYKDEKLLSIKRAINHKGVIRKECLHNTDHNYTVLNVINSKRVEIPQPFSFCVIL
jgi:hypothetical protein